ncbi:CAP domain-containing protein [Streptomyces sp. NPDC048527]|uniref:CAP domain-containing protein n=1 Tax=Streptomyces sp. NPDC048527 TaxID=3365568 RepID=UPI0037226603
MGRHRRADAGRATDSAAGSYAGHDGTYETVPTRQTGAYDGSHEEIYAPYGFAAPYGTGPRATANGAPGRDFDNPYLAAPETAYTPAGTPGHNSHRRRKRAARPVRTGLLGVSAAVAMGAVAVASGVIPGMDNYSLGGGNGADKVRAADSPSGLETQGGTDGSADRAPSSASRGAKRSDPSASPSQSSAKLSSTPSKTASKTPSPSKSDSSGSGSTKTSPTTPPKTATTKAKPPVAAPNLKAPSGEASAEAQVLALVNTERAKAGCRPVTADGGLAALAGNFSEDMAARGFFDHTDPDGATPWDRAKKAGITDLGGENIARGQANAQSVMDSWMNSPGHRANILNCDYTTLGVGVHFGSGGPWWTQDFGF